MEKTISLDYLERKWFRMSFWGYGLGLLIIGTSLARSIKENGLSFWTVAVLVLLAVILTTRFIFSHKKSFSRVVIVKEKSITVRFSPLSKLRTLAAGDIQCFTIHPNRVDLVLRNGQDRVLTLAPYAYQEVKRLKEVLREFAAVHQIQLVESSSSLSQRKGDTPH